MTNVGAAQCAFWGAFGAGLPHVVRARLAGRSLLVAAPSASSSFSTAAILLPCTTVLLAVLANVSLETASRLLGPVGAQGAAHAPAGHAQPSAAQHPTRHPGPMRGRHPCPAVRSATQHCCPSKVGWCWPANVIWSPTRSPTFSQHAHGSPIPMAFPPAWVALTGKVQFLL